MRAVVDDRSGRSCEGVLHLRHVPSVGYAQVNVLVDGWAIAVRSDSIEVLVEDEVSVEELERLDPLVGEPGWRRIVDLAEAAEHGVLQAERVGGTWDDLFGALAERARPLLEAGWQLVSTDRDESWEYGDSVFWDLERDGRVIELEYYEHGQLVLYPTNEAAPADDVTEPVFSIHGSSPASALEALRTHGFIDG